MAVCLIALPYPGSPSSGQGPPSNGADNVVDVSANRAPLNAEQLLGEAINRAARLDSVSADLLETVEMLNQTFTVKGHFLKASGSRVYLELKVVGAGGASFTNLQVCDGETLWDHQDIAEFKVFTRLSLRPILERLTAADLDPKTKETTMSQIGIAGVDSLLAGLRSFYKFTSVDAEPGMVDNQPVWILHGAWSSTRGLLAVDARPDSPPRLLPPYIPGEATVYLGKADYWPYKVALVGTQPAVPMDTRRRGLNGEPIGARSSIIKLEPTRIVLTYSNVTQNASIPADRFQAPAPRGSVMEDRTQSMLDALEKAPRIAIPKPKGEKAREPEPQDIPPIEIDLPGGARPR
jgi:hypothetical protein